MNKTDSAFNNAPPPIFDDALLLWVFKPIALALFPSPGLNAEKENTHGSFSEDFYFIVPDKCTECVGFHEEPQCAAVCPVDCCVPDEEHVESNDELLAKKDWMHEWLFI